MFSELCYEMEVAGRKGNFDGADTTMKKIDQLFPTVVSYLEAYLAKCSA